MNARSNSNHLVNEKSPYLLQHAHNPVDWYPWGEGAFGKARKENKPVFLSIGYSTCHWCHVMAHESFEDEEVAELMNETFVSIKVDREERPDVDSIYMRACQLMTGSGGWPLTIIMTPDKKPFFATTYLPKRGRAGMPGMMELIPAVRKLWEEQREGLESMGEKVVDAIEASSVSTPGGQPGEDIFKDAYGEFSRSFDGTYGGFGTAPKFPTPQNLIFLLRYWKRSGDKKALEMVEKTLQGMRLGGIYDHIGFGFHRYSTDREWHTPHFEKMIYDQAMIAIAYMEAYQATGRAEYG
ncbi:MAG: thioredoxin domain-containing protein, partial [Thermoplasmata archaeon]|nr:thioredoxin domain-containing protein [Thermoplasmata archaeon]